MKPTTEDAAYQLYELLLCAMYRKAPTLPDVRAYVESQRALSTPKRKSRPGRKKRGAK